MMRICAKAVLPFLMLSSAAHAQSQNLFFRPPTYPINGQTVTADFNGDGKPDIVTLDGTVLLGKGDGTFTVGTPWSLGPKISASAIATGDFNGDGKPDLVVSASPFLYVLLGNGDGTFQAGMVTNLGTGLNQIVVADVNGDGKADVIGVGPLIFVLLGNGSGSFTSNSTYPLLSPCPSASVIAVGDFNGDRKPDIAVAGPGASGGSCTSGGTLGVFLGNGDGTFQPVVTSAVVISPAAVVADDFNGDGKLDLAIVDGGTSQTFMLLGNGNGTFQTASAPVPAWGALGAADLNGDGKPDLVVWNPLFVSIFLGNGDGTFTAKDTYLPNLFQLQAGIVIADFNGDGKLDLAASNTVLLGNGDGSFQGNSAIALNVPPLYGPSLGTVVTGDFNRDGIPDIAVAAQSGNPSASHNLYILLGDGTGKFSLAHTYALTTSAYSLMTADFNGDGKPDLLFITIDSTNSWSFDVMLGNGDGSFAGPVVTPQVVNNIGSLPFGIADFNGDHIPDIAAIVNGEVGIFLGKGDGTFGSPVSYFAGAGPTSLVTADFNNDGRVDIAVGTSSGITSAGIGVLLGKGDGTFQSPIFSDSGSSTTAGTRVAATADLNGDGIADIVVSPDVVLLGNGDGTFTPLPPANLTASLGLFETLVDVNGDGKLDLVDSLGLRVFFGNGDGTFNNPITIVAPESNGLVVSGQTDDSALFAIADFNRDGRPDVALVVSADTGGVVTFLNIAPPPAPDFLISASPLSPALVTPGSSASSTVTLTSIGGFNGGVALSCSGLPSGANCSFAPSSLPSGSGTSTLTISIAASTPVGTFPVSIVSASTNLSHSRVVTLTVANTKAATSVGLAPTALTFSQQLSGTTSSAQSTTLADTGPAPLAISGISVTGTNAGDFAQSNNCGSSLAVGANCQITVTFSPTGMGARIANILVSDNATGSPQMVTLSGTGQDFSMATSGAASVTVAPGQPASYTISITPGGGFNQSVVFTCTGAPALTMCTVSPNPISLSGTSAVNATVTIMTMAPSHGSALPSRFDIRVRTNYEPQSFLLGLLGVIMIASLLVWHRNRRLRWTRMVALAVSLLTGMTITSCGSGNSVSNGGSPGTLAGTYTLTVSASATSGTTTLTHSTNLTLVVQ